MYLKVFFNSRCELFGKIKTKKSFKNNNRKEIASSLLKLQFRKKKNYNKSSHVCLVIYKDRLYDTKLSAECKTKFNCFFN